MSDDIILTSRRTPLVLQSRVNPHVTLHEQTVNARGPKGDDGDDGGGPGGSVVHNDTTDRDAANAHPISAITGLQAALDAAGGADEVVYSPTAPGDTSKSWVRTAENLLAFQDFRALDDQAMPSETNGYGPLDPATIGDFNDFVPEFFQPARVINGRYAADAAVTPQTAGIYTAIGEQAGAYRVTVGLGDWMHQVGDPIGQNSVNIVIADGTSSGPFVHCYADQNEDDGRHCRLGIGYDLLGDVNIVDEVVVPFGGSGDRFALGFDGDETWTAYWNGEAVGTLEGGYPGDATALEYLTLPSGATDGAWCASTEWFALADGDFDPQDLTLHTYDGDTDEWVRRIEPDWPRPDLPERILALVGETGGAPLTVEYIAGDTTTELEPGVLYQIDPGGGELILPAAEDNLGAQIAVNNLGLECVLTTAPDEFVQTSFGLDGIHTDTWVLAPNTAYLWVAGAVLGGFGWFAVSMDTATDTGLPAGGAAGDVLAKASGSDGDYGFLGRNVADGYAGLDSSGLVPDAIIPAGVTRDSELTSGLAGVVGGAPSDLNTLNKVAAALGNDAAFAATAATALGQKQPVDADLTAIALLSTTTFGRALLTMADAGAARTALALGSAATQASSAFDAAGAATAAQAAAIAASQPVDSDLTAIAALTTTSFGRSFLALADAAAARTLLGLAPSGFPYMPVAPNDWAPLWIPYGTGSQATSTGGSATASNSAARYLPFKLEKRIGVAGLGIEIAAGNAGASAVLRFGIHADNAGRPGSVEAEVTAAATTGVREATFTEVFLDPGWHWAMLAFQSLDTAGTNPTIRCINAMSSAAPRTSIPASANQLAIWGATVAGALAANPTVSTTMTAFPLLWMKISTP